MRNSKYKHITIGGEDYSKYFHFPFTIQQSLNEQLDYAVVELRNTTLASPFPPFTEVAIGSLSDPLLWILGIDEVTEVMGTGLFNHTMTLLETTKEAERFVMSAKAFTNPLVRDYTEITSPVNAFWLSPFPSVGNATELKYTLWETETYISEKFTSPIRVGTFNLYKDFFGNFLDPETTDFVFSVLYNDGKSPAIFKDLTVTFNPQHEVHSSTYHFSQGTVGEQPDIFGSFEIDKDKEGIYGVILKITRGEFANPAQFVLYFEISVVEEPVDKPRYTVRDVVEQLLETAETLREDERPRYQLEEAGITDLLDMEAPEFRFSNGRTLWENLREVGRYIHAMPRIYQNWRNAPKKVTFDRLGQTAFADMSKGRRVAKTSTYNIGDYTAGLDALVSNLVNVNDDGLGTVTDPFGGGYLTMRTAKEEARIMEGSAFIKTHFPIEKIVKIEVGGFALKKENGESVEAKKEFEEIDITPYVFEKSEYDTLLSSSGKYPFSKTYALYYSQGSPNIEGLWFKAQDTGIGALDAFQNYAITNVIEQVAGVSSGFFNSVNYTDLTFRITYVPTVTARVRQYRQTYDGSFPSVLSHNQSASKLSSKALGENLRGQLAMLGTTSDSVTYMFPTLGDVPKAGLLYDEDDYISTVATRVYGDFVISQIGLSTGYNELGGYVEVNNQIRQFEIPDSNDRYTHLEEFCIIGDDVGDDEELCFAEELQGHVRGLCSTSGGGGVSPVATLARVETFNDDMGRIAWLELPCVSMPVGNSLYYGFSFEDNFSAGSNANGKIYASGDKKYKLQTYVPYGDAFYAHAYALGFELYSGAVPFDNVDDQIEQGDTLPQATIPPKGTLVASTGKYPIVWHKDSADAGHISYQLHFVSNNNILMGSHFAEMLMSQDEGQTERWVMAYFFDHKINPLGEDFDTTDAVASCSMILGQRAVQFSKNEEELPPFQAWAIFAKDKFLIGKNTSQFEKIIYFNFKRRLTT